MIAIVAASSFSIVPSPLASVAVTSLFVMPDRSTVNVSSGSTTASPVTDTVIVCVSPSVPVNETIPVPSV